jgi:hypothetical protein
MGARTNNAHLRPDQGLSSKNPEDGFSNSLLKRIWSARGYGGGNSLDLGVRAGKKPKNNLSDRKENMDEMGSNGIIKMEALRKTMRH